LAYVNASIVCNLYQNMLADLSGREKEIRQALTKLLVGKLEYK